MLHTTFKKAKEAGACIRSYRKMAKALGGVEKYGLDTPIPLDEVLEVCGLDDALWALRIILEPADREIRLFTCDCAERVLFLYEEKYPQDKRPRVAIETARRYADGQATARELAIAEAIAWAAAGAAPGAAPWAIAEAVAGAAAWTAARAAPWAIAEAVAWAIAEAVTRAVAEVAPGAVAEVAAWVAEKEWQKARLIELLKEVG